MPAMTKLLVKDDDTAAEFTFNDISDNPTPFWRTGIAGVPVDGQHRLTFSLDKQKSGDYKASAKLELCVLETLGASGTSAGYVAPPKVAYTLVGIFTMFIPARSTAANRGDLMKLLLGVLQGASSTTATGVLNQASAADAFTASVLPGPLFFTQLVLPS